MSKSHNKSTILLTNKRQQSLSDLNHLRSKIPPSLFPLPPTHRGEGDYKQLRIAKNYHTKYREIALYRRAEKKSWEIQKSVLLS